jgi:hypothetical protein
MYIHYQKEMFVFKYYGWTYDGSLFKVKLNLLLSVLQKYPIT